MILAALFSGEAGRPDATTLLDQVEPGKVAFRTEGWPNQLTYGFSGLLPIADKLQYQHYGITPDWRDLAGYFARLEKQGMGINLGTYVGATQVRRMIIGGRCMRPCIGNSGATTPIARSSSCSRIR